MTLGTPHPFLMVDIFAQVVEVDPVLLRREVPFGCERSAVAAVVVFGEAAVVPAADIPFVVATLAPGGRDRRSLTVAAGLMGGVTRQTPHAALHSFLAAAAIKDMAFEAFAPEKIIDKIGRSVDRFFREREALEGDV